MQRRKLFFAVLAVMLVGVCAAREPGEPLKPGFNMFSVEQDIQLGKEAAQQVSQQKRIARSGSHSRNTQLCRLLRKRGAGPASNDAFHARIAQVCGKQKRLALATPPRFLVVDV